MLRLPGPQLFGGDGIGQRAAGVGVGDQHGLVGGEQLGRLGHEVDPGEDDGRSGCLGGDAGQGERITHVVGHVLDLR